MSSAVVHREAVPLAPEWSDLPEELLELVLRNLPSSSFSDFIRFRSVCKEWRSLAKPDDLPMHLPLLMLPHHPLADVRSFFCPATGKSFHVSLPELAGKAVLASSFGWMVLLDIDTKALSLLNPVTRAKIELPPADGFHQLLELRLAPDGNGLRLGPGGGVPLGAMEFGTMCRWEVSLSSSPSSAGEDCFVVVSDTCKVFFCKPGDSSWSSLSHAGARSAVYHHGRLYIVGANSELSIFDAGTLSKLKTIPSPIRSEAIYRYFISLAKTGSPSELVMFAGNPNIVKERDPFQVFKIDMDKAAAAAAAEEEEELGWSSISNLHEMAFYWSMKQCMVVVNGAGAAAGAPANTANGRIYFDGAPYKHEVEDDSHQISICSMKDGDCEVLSCGGDKPSEKLMKPAWVTLSLS